MTPPALGSSARWTVGVVGAWCVARKDTAVVVFEAWGAPFDEAGSVGALLADELGALDALLAQ